nr:probable F-box protein At3g61730 isoform X1 [Arachis hypogaea]
MNVYSQREISLEKGNLLLPIITKSTYIDPIPVTMHCHCPIYLDFKMNYADGSHSYMFRQQEKHIDWMRIGAFSFDSSVAILAERLSFPGKIKERETLEKMLRSQGCCVVENVKPGIWIADLQLVRCPVCDLNTCDGTMQTLDARHIELFLCEGYKNGSWDYQLVGSHDIKKRADGAAGAIFDAKHLEDSSTSAVFDYKSWIGKPNDWQPKAMIAFHAVAVNTNLQENEGKRLKISYIPVFITGMNLNLSKTKIPNFLITLS